MPDLGNNFVGSCQDLAGFHRAVPISTWAGQNLIIVIDENTSHKGRYHLDCKKDDSKVSLRDDSLV